MINWLSVLPMLHKGGGMPNAAFGGMPDYISQSGQRGAPVSPNGMFAQAGGGPKDLRPQAQPEAAPQQKTPWLQQQGMGGLQRGELLLAGMGMLGGRNFSEGLANAGGTLYGVMNRQQKEAEEAKKKAALLKAMTAGGKMTPEQAEAWSEFGPEIAIGQMNRAEDIEIDTARYEKGEQWKERQWLRDENRWETEEEWRRRTYDRGVLESDRAQDNWQTAFNRGVYEFNTTREDALAAAQAEAASGSDRKMEKDQNGILRYVDTGEPVFPGVETTTGNKPLIGAESMARVAAGLPTAKEAVAGIRSLVFDSKGTMFSVPGYDPGHDFGAGVIQDLGHFPVVGGAIRGLTDPLSRIVGGADYQKFEDSYSAYEAAILPIMSGAAVTDTEALRQLRAVRIKSGDNQETKERKIRAMELQVQGLEMAARGDVNGFLSLLDQAGEEVGTGPVKRGAAPADAGDLSTASDDDLFYILRGN